MKKDSTKKIYAYVDESGQDSEGLIFVVSVLVFEKGRENILEKLELAETKSGKKKMK